MLEKNVKILHATPDDALGILNVLHKTWLDTYPNDEIGITEDDIEDSYKDSFTEGNVTRLKDKIANIPVNQKRIVAKNDNLVVGVSTFVENEENNQLKTMYVLPDFQGKGIGQMLWNEMSKFFNPNKDIIVQVATYNVGAINFYKKKGFVDTGKRFTDEHFKMKSGAMIPEMEMVIKTKNLP